MITIFLLAALEPTNKQVDVYITNVIRIDYETPSDFQDQVNSIENFIRGKAGNPSNYQFKTSDQFDVEVDCKTEKKRKIKEYQDSGLNVQEVTYFGRMNMLELKFNSPTDFYSTTISLPHLMSMRMTFSYSADNENTIAVRDYNGAMIRISNNFAGGDNSPLLIAQNISGREILYSVESLHKNTPPDGDEPWYQSWGQILSNSENEVMIGWKDRPQNTIYRNAIVSVFIY